MEILDTRGLNCPMPSLMARKRLSELPPGARLTVLASDPMAAIDVPHLAQEDGHRVISSEEEAGELRFVLERGSGG